MNKKSKIFFILTAISIVITIIFIFSYSKAISERDSLYWLSSSDKANMDYGREMYKLDTSIKYCMFGIILMGIISISFLITAILLRMKGKVCVKNKENPNRYINTNNSNQYKDLEYLSELKEKGVLTEEEFKEQKAKILK